MKPKVSADGSKMNAQELTEYIDKAWHFYEIGKIDGSELAEMLISKKVSA
jgi:hypothetical protein